MTLAALAQAAASARGPLLLPDGPGLEATYYFSPENVTYGQGAHAVVVEVDVETCEVRIRRYVVAHDCGRVLNATIVEGQVIGGIAQGVGGALYEQLCFDPDGQYSTPPSPTTCSRRSAIWCRSRSRTTKPRVC